MSAARILLAGTAALALAGCYEDEPYYADGSEYAYCAAGIDASEIDSGGTLDLDPGIGAGVTAEYLGDGAWRFATACDTERSGYPCRWDILISARGGEVTGFAPESLERNDSLDWSPGADAGSDDAVRLVAISDYDLDAFTLDATPGATLEVDAILDDQCGGTFVHWLREGRVTHARTQVVDLTPSAP